MNKRLIYICITICFLLLALCGCGTKSAPINSVQDLNGKTIIVELGTSFESSILKNGCIESPKFIYGTTNADSIELLVGNKGDALVLDKPVAQSTVFKYPQLKLLDYTFDDAQMGFAMQKGSPLKSKVDGAIEVLAQSGELYELVKKWMGNDQSLKVIDEQSWSGKNGTLRVAIESSFEPMSYLDKDGQPVGLDIDVLTQIGKLLDMKVEFTTLPSFSMLLPSVEEGIFDLAAGGITITDERLLQVDFSKSYYETSSVFVVRDPEAAAASLIEQATASFKRTFIDDERWKDILSGLGATVLFIVITGLCGIIIGNMLFLWCRSGSKVGNVVMTALDKFFLYVPASTWLFIAFYLIFRGRMANPMVVAGFAMSLLFSIDVFHNFDSAVGHVDIGQFEAAYSIGYTKYQAYRKLIIPQISPEIFSTLQEDLVMHIRTTSLVGLISAMDIQMVFDLIRSETNDTVIPILFTTLAYVGMGVAFSAIVKAINIKCDRMRRTPKEIEADIRRGEV